MKRDKKKKKGKEKAKCKIKVEDAVSILPSAHVTR